MRRRQDQRRSIKYGENDRHRASDVEKRHHRAHPPVSLVQLETVSRVEAAVDQAKVADNSCLRVTSRAGRELKIAAGIRFDRLLHFLDLCDIALRRVVE